MVTVTDVVALVGLVLLCVGLWMVYPPLCLIVLGGIMMLAAASATKAKGKE